MTTAPQPALFCAYRPGPPLDRFVEQIWYWEGLPTGHARERIMPSGCATLIVNLMEDEVRNYGGANDDIVETFPGAVLVGAHSRYSVIDTLEQRAVMGIGFRPGGTWPFFDAAADEAHNQHIGLRELWGSPGATLRERILTAPTPMARVRLLADELLERAVRPLVRRAEIDFALKQLGRMPPYESIASLSERVGLSSRRFTRLFTLEVGISPKLYARIKRFERARGLIATLRDINWSDVAQTCGYFDQSHLIRDCRSLSGLTPGDLARRRINGHHVAI